MTQRCACTIPKPRRRTEYVYDDDGVRVSELTHGSTNSATVYLNDPYNPTGYSKTLEKQTGTSVANATLNTSYILGSRVEGQKDSTGVVYFIRDGHGSDRLLTDSSGAAVANNSYDYTEFGDAIGFDPTASTTRTTELFGGDGSYDPASGFTYHLARWRSGFLFTQMDSYAGDTQDPLSLHKYLYAEDNPITGDDPSGQFFLADMLASAADDADEEAEGFGIMGAIQPIVDNLKLGIDVYEGTQAGFMNAALAPTGVSWEGAFAVGFMSGFGQSFLHNDLGMACFVAAGFGGAVLQGGNDVLAGHGSVGDVLGAAATAMLLTAVLQGGCFTAGTEVLLGDGKTEEAIDQIHVGQRVATDGGVANSPDGKTKAADPKATQINRKTWRLVTIDADGWQVQTLEPLSEIKALHEKTGGSITLSNVVDLKEMGVPDGLFGTIDSIAACPKIQHGPGRVVLTTISHQSDQVYHLTLRSTNGKNDTISITAYHRVYTEDRGWVVASELVKGEVVRTAHGDATVSKLVRDPGVFAVYNMTVESDHDYYVGDLTALVHNSCKTGKTGQYEVTFGNDMKYIGKGDYLRAIESAMSNVGENGGLDSIKWTQYATDADALIAEAIAMAKNGGIEGGKLLNKINSPGLKLWLEELLEG